MEDVAAVFEILVEEVSGDDLEARGDALERSSTLPTPSSAAHSRRTHQKVVVMSFQNLRIGMRLALGFGLKTLSNILERAGDLVGFDDLSTGRPANLSGADIELIEASLVDVDAVLAAALKTPSTTS
mgnify:CR=1 FL=1